MTNRVTNGVTDITTNSTTDNRYSDLIKKYKHSIINHNNEQVCTLCKMSGREGMSDGLCHELIRLELDKLKGLEMNNKLNNNQDKVIDNDTSTTTIILNISNVHNLVIGNGIDGISLDIDPSKTSISNKESSCTSEKLNTDTEDDYIPEDEEDLYTDDVVYITDNETEVPKDNIDELNDEEPKEDPEEKYKRAMAYMYKLVRENELSKNAIAMRLNDLGFVTKLGKEFTSININAILRRDKEKAEKDNDTKN